jgi:hypothetical protein
MKKTALWQRIPGAAVVALLLLTTPALPAGTPASAKDIIVPAPAAAPFIPPPMFGDWVDPDGQPIISGEDTKTVVKKVPPIATSYGPFKIGENESPLPQDRVYLTYNLHTDVGGYKEVHREILGLEKTFLAGDLSLGLRLPFLQTDRHDGGEDTSEFDDPSVIFKYVLLRNGGFTLSGGISVSIPVNAYEPVEGGGDKHIPLLQPFVGYVWQRGNFFVHGFTSLAVPTDEVLPTILFNDIGIGWNCPCDMGPVTVIVPTIEVHVNTPLNHRDEGDPERRRNSVDLTAGVHLLLGEKAWLGLGVGTTVTNPRLFDVEALVSLNVRL